MHKHRYSNYYAHPKKARSGSTRKPRAPPKKVDYDDDAEIIGLLPDDARLDLPTRDCGRTPRAQPKKLDDAEIIGTLPTRTNPMKGTNVFKFDFKSEAPVQLAFPHRPLGTGMSLEEMFKAIVDGDDKPAQTKRQRDAEEDTDGHDGDDEKEATGKQSARGDATRRATVAREVTVVGTKRRKLRV